MPYLHAILRLMCSFALLFIYDLIMINMLFDNYFQPLNLGAYSGILLFAIIMLVIFMLAFYVICCSQCGCACCSSCTCTCARGCVMNAKLNKFIRAQKYRNLNHKFVFAHVYCCIFEVFAVLGQISSFANANNTFIFINLVLVNFAFSSGIIVNAKFSLRIWMQIMRMGTECSTNAQMLEPQRQSACTTEEILVDVTVSKPAKVNSSDHSSQARLLDDACE